MKINLKNLYGLASTKRRQTVLNPFVEPVAESKPYGRRPSISLTYGRTTPAWMGGLDWTEKRKRKHQSLLCLPTRSACLDNSPSGREVPS